jgi:hypothetical protein
MGGQQPLTGTVIKLYAVGSLGNGSPATDLLGTGSNGPATSVSSGSDGSFNITGDYTCPVLAPSTPVYLTATGGNPGLVSGTDNTAIALVAALGPCDQLLANAATTYITINEATTAAAAWALSPFATSLTSIGSTGTNLTGITNAIATANQLADPTTGLSPGSSTPPGAIMESAKLYSLADILASCVNSNGKDTACSTLFSDVTPTDGTPPTDTFSAALSVVKNPGNNVTNIFKNHVGSTPPFAALSSAPSDWTMSIGYDPKDPTFAQECPLEYGVYGCASIGQVAIDSNGNVWTGNSALFGFSHQGVPIAGSPFVPPGGFLTPGGGVDYVSYGIAIDKDNNIWEANQVAGTGGVTGNILEYDDAGNLLSPSAGYTNGIGGPFGVAFDTSGQLWVANEGAANLATVSVAVLNSAGSLVSSVVYPALPANIYPYRVAIDGNNKAWFSNVDDCLLPGYGSCSIESLSQPPTPVVTQVTTAVPTVGVAVDSVNNVWFTANTTSLLEITSAGTLVSSAATGGGMIGGNAIAVDGANHLWVVTPSRSVSANPALSHPTAFAEFTGGSVGAGTALSPATGYGLDASAVLNTTVGLAIDSSGSLWVTNTYPYPLVTTIVGVAVPVKTPLIGPPQAP